MVHGTVAEVIDRDAQLGDDGTMRYDIHQVDVIEVLRGPELEQVEVVLMADVARTELAHRPTPAPGDQGLWFLTEIDPMFDRDGYVLTTSQGLLVEADRQLVGARPGSPLHKQIETLEDLERAVDYLRAR